MGLHAYFTKKSSVYCTAKTQYRKFETKIPRKVIVCERLIYSHDWSAYSAARKYVDRSWQNINRSQTHECVTEAAHTFSGNT